MTYRIAVAPAAARQLRKLDPPARRWVQGAIELLAENLRTVAADAQDLLDDDRRVCLVHGDFNAKNLLVDPAALEVTGVLDWEFAMAGSPHADLGNLLRFDRSATFVDAVISAYRGFMPAPLVPDVGDLLARARAADLFALVELAARQWLAASGDLARGRAAERVTEFTDDPFFLADGHRLLDAVSGSAEPAG